MRPTHSELLRFALDLAECFARSSGYERTEFYGAAWLGLRKALIRESPDYPIEKTVRVCVRSALIDELRVLRPFSRRGQERGMRQVPLDELSSDPYLVYAPTQERHTLFHELLEIDPRSLTARELLVMNDYFLEEQSLTSIAERLSVSEPRASQMKTSAIRKLRLALTG
jgi:RNA polymerase sigma factor (sigma-70 family)